MLVNIVIIINIFYIYSSSILTFPFKRNFTDETNNFHDYYFDNTTYTKLYIGTPNTEIFLQIKSKYYSLCIKNDTIYNYFNSSSYKITNDKQELGIYNRDFRYCVKSNETFILGNEKITIDNLKYLLTKESKYDSDGVLGLQILDNDGKVRGYSLIPQLKEKKLIEKECFFYIFDKDSDDGELIIGEYPHLIDKYKNKFHEEQFQVTSVFIPSFDQNFDFQFRSVFWNGVEIGTLSVGHIEVESGIIIGSMKFCDLSWDFFAPHFRKKRCSRVDVHVLYESYICDDYEDFDITKFPSIKFYVNDADYSFELTYEDIFKKIDGKVYFMVCFNKKGYDVNWNLGNIFLKRNMLVFDMDRKIMGFYNQNISYNNNESNKNYNNDYNNSKNNMLLLIIIIIITNLALFGLVVFIFIKFIFNKRPKKAYELNDDDYDYASHKITV